MFSIMPIKITTVIFIYVFYFCPHRIESQNSKLVHGVPAVESDFPSYVMFREKMDALPLCAGALVTRQHVLTIASCVASSQDHISFRGYLVAGSVSTTLCPWYSCQFRKAGNIYVDPGYKLTRRNEADSVAIVFAERPFSMDQYVKPVDWTSKVPKRNVQLTMSLLSADQSSLHLAYVDVTESKSCLTSGKLPEKMIVVKSREPPYVVAKGIDKGSPVYDWHEHLVGLVSPVSQVGKNCTSVRIVSHYTDFIEDLIMLTPKQANRRFRTNDSSSFEIGGGRFILSAILFILNFVDIFE